MNPRNNDKLDAATLGKIAFARFLSLPLKAYDRGVAEIESSAAFRQLSPWLEAARLDEAAVHDAPPAASPPTLGAVCMAAGPPRLVYHRASYVREYRFDEAGLSRLRHALPPEAAAVLCRLRLVNSRNRLTHALMRELFAEQAAYLASGDRLALRALPQARMSRLLTERANLPLVVDGGRLSRLVRGLSFRMADGRALPLRTLFPSERQLHCHRLDDLMKREKALLLETRAPHPLPDEAIAALLRQQYGVSLSRRSVAAIRHQLAIPDWRRRGERKDYLAATEGFSPLLPLTPEGLAAAVPPHSGVYEIRSAEEERNPHDDVHSPARPRVVYIGSTRDLRKRLADHLRGNNGNIRLCNYLSAGGARVRFRIVREGWRQLERHLYLTFCETFGSPPPCNRMTP